RPLYVVPAFFKLTDSPTTSTTESLFFTSAATPTAKWRLLDLNMAMGLSSLDKPDCPYCPPRGPILSTPLSIPSGSIEAGLLDQVYRTSSLQVGPTRRCRRRGRHAKQ